LNERSAVKIANCIRSQADRDPPVARHNGLAVHGRRRRPSLNEIAKNASTVLGEPVEIRMHVVRSYEEGVELITSGRVDFARLGPVSYVIAKNANPGLSILATERKNGGKVFKGIIIVAKDSPIGDASQLRGKSFAFGNENSTIGRYLAQRFLIARGIRAADLSRYDYLGRHDKVGHAVGAGLFDAGSLKETTFNKLVAQGVPIRAIARFDSATKPWVVRANLPASIRNALQQALMMVEDGEAFKALRFDGFSHGRDSDYTAIRQAITENAKFFAGAL
jgi:phosphonate transport system substrate-binding protein